MSNVQLFVTGLVQGRAASVFAAVGCRAGFVPHLLAMVLGLAAVMHTSALAFQVLKVAGVACLCCVACSTWRDKSAFAVDNGLFKASTSGLVIKAFLLHILNPKLTIFSLAFLPQFVERGVSRPLPQLLLPGAVFIVNGFVAHALRKRISESPRVQRGLRCGLAAAFAGLEASLALAEN
jgi:threonine/homoserine/homoserine lactone efflux protein